MKSITDFHFSDHKISEVKQTSEKGTVKKSHPTLAVYDGLNLTADVYSWGWRICLQLTCQTARVWCSSCVTCCCQSTDSKGWFKHKRGELDAVTLTMKRQTNCISRHRHLALIYLLQLFCEWIKWSEWINFLRSFLCIVSIWLCSSIMWVFMHHWNRVPPLLTS